MCVSCVCACACVFVRENANIRRNTYIPECVSYCVERNLWPGRMLHICKLTISFKFHARHAETSQQQQGSNCLGRSHMSLVSVRGYICPWPTKHDSILKLYVIYYHPRKHHTQQTTHTCTHTNDCRTTKHWPEIRSTCIRLDCLTNAI